MGANQSHDLKNAGIWPQVGGSLSCSMMKNGWLKLVEPWAWTESENESCSVMSNSLWLQARILEWVAFPFSRGSSQPRDWTQVSRIAGRFFTNWTIREAWAWVGGELIVIIQPLHFSPLEFVAILQMITAGENVNMYRPVSPGCEYQYLWKLYLIYALFICSKYMSLKMCFSPPHYHTII